MYEGLLLSTGGGIITNATKSAQQGEPTIIVGLGGTGVEALKITKRKVYDQLIADNPGDEIPEYKHIGFLAIDTDAISGKNGNKNVYNLRDSEILSIQVTNLNGKMKEDIRLRKKEFDWLQKDLELLSEDGAGTIRQVGRYCLFKNIDQVVSKIENLKKIVTKDTGKSKVNVHIIAGISGGTGSGTFIDMCYILREVLGTGATLFGYFFMPDVNLDKPDIGETIAKCIKSNGYAALKELDYTMNLGNEGKTFSQYYGGSKLYSIKETSSPLVDLCHLISATEQNGTAITNGYMYSMNIVGEYILSYLAAVETDAVKEDEPAVQTLEGHLANVRKLVNSINKKNGENLNYHILGASTAELPTREIGTYLATKLYNKIKVGLTENRPNDPAVKEHADAMGLNLKSFRKRLYDDGSIQGADAIRWQGADDFSIEDILNIQIIVDGRVDETNIVMTDKILRPARIWKEKNVGALEENFQKLVKNLDDFTLIKEGENATTLISTVFQYLQNNIVSDLKYGAVYASKLTHNPQGESLNDRLSGLIKEAQEAKKHCEKDMEQRVRDILDAVKFCREKCTSIIFGTKKKQEEGVEQYRAAIRAYYQNEFNIKVYQKIQEMADNLKEQIDKEDYSNSLYPKYFKPLEGMLLKLKSTFDKNSEYFEMPEESDDEFVRKIVKFSEIKGYVDSKLAEEIGKEEDAPNPKQYKDFVEKIMTHYGEWIGSDAAKVEKMINTYIEETFGPLLKIAMEDYLHVKYHTNHDQEKLQEEIENDLLKGDVLAKAEPKFYIDTKHTIAPATKHVLSVPKEEANICAAAQKIVDEKAGSDEPLAFRRTGLGNKIFAVKFESGIPLCAYGLIDKLEEQYKTAGIGAKGRHLYEITERNESINWANLQSFIPYSIKPEACADGKDLEQLYHEAVKRGVIAENKYNITEYDVYELTEPAIKKRDDFMKEGRIDINELNSYVEKLKSYIESYIDGKGKLKSDNGKNENIKETKKLLNDGSNADDNDYREVCRIDYFIRFRGLQEVVKESLKILDDVDAAIKEATEWQNEGEEREKTIRLITEALCLDFFEAGIGKYTYNGVLLWSGTMKYGKFPVYQIYQTFSSDAFTDNERESLEHDVNNKINDLKSTDKEKVEKIKNKYIDNINTGINNAIKQASVLSEFGDIETVYKLFEREVQALLNLFEM